MPPKRRQTSQIESSTAAWLEQLSACWCTCVQRGSIQFGNLFHARHITFEFFCFYKKHTADVSAIAHCPIQMGLGDFLRPARHVVCFFLLTCVAFVDSFSLFFFHSGLKASHVFSVETNMCNCYARRSKTPCGSKRTSIPEQRLGREMKMTAQRKA